MVAAQGNQHWFVSKKRSVQNTATVFTTLTPDDRVQELARLLAVVTKLRKIRWPMRVNSSI